MLVQLLSVRTSKSNFGSASSSAKVIHLTINAVIAEVESSWKAVRFSVLTRHVVIDCDFESLS